MAEHPQPNLVRALLQGAVCAAALALILPTTADTDLWGHLRFGLDAVADRGLAPLDPYSFTSDRPWINHEWLAEVSMAVAYLAADVPGLIVAKTLLVVIALVAALWCIRIDRLHTWRTDVLAGFIFVTGLLPLASTFRPQVFSVLFFVVLLAVIRYVDASGRPRLLWVIPPLFMLWANAHGGWLVGATVLAIWTVVTVANPRCPIRVRVVAAVVGIVAASATLINPYGLGLWTFLFETVGFARDDIEEWRSIAVHRELLIPWLVTTALFVWIMIRGKSWRWSYAAIALFLGYSAFNVARLGAFYSMAVGLLLGPSLADRAPEDSAGLPQAPRPYLRRLRLTAAVVTFVTVTGLFLATNAQRLSCIQPSPPIGLDLEAATFIQENHLEGRLLVWFNWGEFVIWHFAPQLKVSMDGRRETVYSSRTLEAHQSFWRDDPGARPYMESLQPDYIWIPNIMPVHEKLPRWGWYPLHRTASSTVWGRSPGADLAAPTESGSPCFPALQRGAQEAGSR